MYLNKTRNLSITRNHRRGQIYLQNPFKFTPKRLSFLKPTMPYHYLFNALRGKLDRVAIYYLIASSK